MDVRQGDCLEVLKTLEPNSIDSLVTDPPAGISFMNKSWDSDKDGRDEWILWMTEVMSECSRVLKPGAHALVWSIPRTSHWTTTAVENAGFEVRDVVTHLFGSGFPKSLDISKAIDKEAGAKRAVVGVNEDYLRRKPNGMKTKGSSSYNYSKTQHETNADITAPSTDEAKQWQGFGTALKPAAEFWVLARKPLSEKTVAKNVLKWGVGGLNIDSSRIEGKPRTTLAAQGRFPANLVFSHTEYCTDLMCDIECAIKRLDEQSGVLKTNAGNDNYGDRPNSNTYGDGWQRPVNQESSSGGASRFFYCAKVSPSERNAGLDGLTNGHPTLKSQRLMQYLIKLITPPGGTVLDPFMGSGSTGLAAKTLGFGFIGIEKEKEYVDIALRRIAQKGTRMFDTQRSIKSDG